QGDFMRIAAWLISGIAGLLCAGALMAQPALPDVALPKNLEAGFDAKTALGDALRPLLGDSPAGEVLKRLWSGGIELGMAGSSGNSDVFKVRTGFIARREANGNLMTSDLMYVMSEVGGAMTENKALWVMRDEVRMGQSNWGMMMSESIEFDQF